MSSFDSYFVQGSSVNISILNAADSTLAGTIAFSNAKTISISENSRYLIAENSVKISAWNIEDVSTPLLMIETPGLKFCFSSSGSNLMIQKTLIYNGF